MASEGFHLWHIKKFWTAWKVPKFLLLGETHSWKYNSNGAAVYVLIVASCEVPVETTSWNQISHKIGNTIFIEGYQVKFLLVDGKIENY